MAEGKTTARRVAVVLFNLGGPDSLKAVRPFLFNLFADPAIIGLPAVARLPLAALISTARDKSAQANYAKMGGASPLLAETRSQAEALGTVLAAQSPGDVTQVFIAMRYWRPFTADAAVAVAAFAPDEIVLVPLYPQFSTTTSGSSLAEWAKAYRGPGRSRAVCCYPTLDGVVDAHVARIEAAWAAAGSPTGLRLLFSAHGLPEKVVDGGDPYAAQVDAMAGAIAAGLGDRFADWQVCYQSRVGPMKWLGPSTVEAIGAAAADGQGVLIVPIAFVSEHVETLVELDRDYAEMAERLDCAPYVRVPALGIEPAFIEALAGLTLHALGDNSQVVAGSDFRCPARWGKCPKLAAQGAG
jgi:ferrochelatase